MFLRFT